MQQKKKTKAVIFCHCGKVNANGNWVLPVIDLAGFIRELQARELATFTFIRMLCADCFEAQGKGERQ